MYHTVISQKNFTIIISYFQQLNRNFIMKKTKIFFALLIASWAIVLSCTNDMDIEGINQPQPVENSILFNKVRLSFDNQKSNDMVIKKLNISPSWTKALVFDNSLEVPYTEKGLVHTPSMVNDNKHQGRSRLLFIEKNGTSKAMIIQYFPSMKFTGKMSEINTNNLMQKHFDGIVIIKGLGNTSGKAFTFENGKLTNQKKVTISPADKNSRKMSLICSTVYVFDQWFDNSCDCWMIMITNVFQICEDDGGGGDGGGNGNDGNCTADPASCMSPCDAFPEICSSGVSSSENNTIQVQGRLCGNYTFTPTGNGRTAEIHGLGAQAYNSSNNNHISASWAEMCITFGNSIQTSNNGSIAFNLAWNNTLQLTDVWLASHPNATSIEFKQIIETILRTQLGPAAGGYYALSIGSCNNVPASNAQTCP
jgi:hypothetical protein